MSSQHVQVQSETSVQRTCNSLPENKLFTDKGEIPLNIPSKQNILYETYA